MTSEGVPFDNVHDWEHLSLSEELFRKKYQESLIDFKHKVQIMKDDYQSYLDITAKSSQTKIKNEENKLEANRRCLEKCVKDIAVCKQDIERISSNCRKIKKASDELNEKLESLAKEEKQLLEQKGMFADEVKKTYNAFLMARKYYKDNLRMHYSIDTTPNASESILNIKFFTSKNTKDSKYSIMIQINKTDHKAELLSTNPKLSVFNELNKRLIESGDYSGLICCVRKCFVKMHPSVIM